MNDGIQKRVRWVQFYEELGNAGLLCLRCGISRLTLRKWYACVGRQARQNHDCFCRRNSGMLILDGPKTLVGPPSSDTGFASGAKRMVTIPLLEAAGCAGEDVCARRFARFFAANCLYSATNRASRSFLFIAAPAIYILVGLSVHELVNAGALQTEFRTDDYYHYHVTVVVSLALWAAILVDTVMMKVIREASLYS